MNEPLRAPQVRAFNHEARRNPQPNGQVIDAFVLPRAAVRPSLFFYLRMGLKWLAGLAVVVVIGLIIVYPRESLFNSLMTFKLLKESFHEAFDPPKKKDSQPPGSAKSTGPAVAQNGKAGGTQSPKATGPGGEAAAGDPPKPKARGSQGATASAKATGAAGAAASDATPQGQGQGGPMNINTPKAQGQAEAPKMALNLVVPGGNGGRGAGAQPAHQGQTPSSIVINNNGGGTANALPPVTVTQLDGSTSEPLAPTPGSSSNQPPPSVVVNGPMSPPPNVAIEGQEQPGGGTAAEGNTAGRNNSGAYAGLRQSMGNPNALARADWPRQVAIRGTPTVTALERGKGSKHPFASQTDHYEFQSDHQLGADVVRELSRVFEATYELTKVLPLGIRPAPENDQPRFVARIFSQDRDYFAAGGMKGSSGTYSRDQACILVPISSLGVKVVNGRMQTVKTETTETLIHEITHQMMNKWLPLVPRWYAEGSAEYVASADYLHGRFFLNQMEDRLRLYLRHRGQNPKQVKMLRPAELIALDAKAWGMAVASNASGASLNYSSATLLTYYFYHLDGDGDCAAMLKYLRALEDGAAEPEALKLLLGERTMSELERDIINAYAERGMDIDMIATKAVATK